MTPKFPNPRVLALVAAAVLLCNSFLTAQIAHLTPKPSSGASFRIAGTVVNATTSQPLARTQVSVTNTKDPNDGQSMVTSDDGIFHFQVKAGKYSLRGEKRGFIASAYDQHETFWTGIVTGAGLDTENLVLRLPPAAAITGKITDEIGDPVREATITVYREDHSTGVSRIQMLSTAITDDLGTYEVTPLSAGTYFVSVAAQPWYAVHPVSSQLGAAAVDRALDAAFSFTYYKDTTESDDATPVPIGPADHAEVDFHISPVPALHLEFRGGALPAFHSPVFEKPTFDGITVPQSGTVEQVSPGIFEITGLAPGKYTLRARGSASGVMKEPTDVYLNHDEQDLDLSAGALTASVKATVQVPGSTKLPSGLTIALRNGKGRIARAIEVNDKGEAAFTDLAPGQYDVAAGSPTKAYSVSRISREGHGINGHNLDVPAGSSLTVSLVLVGGAVTVEGFAKRSGNAAPGAMIVLVPSNPEANLELFRRDQSDQDGSFVLRQVVPGTYTILAIENGWDLDWAKPAVIEHYRQHGQKLVVGDQKGSVRLPGSVEVQPRL